jgi:hypothetical protein
MNANVKYPWQQAVLDAFIEFRSENLQDKITVARGKITERLNDPQQLDPDERRALTDALHILTVFLHSSESTAK